LSSGIYASRAARLGMRPKRQRNGKRGRRALIRLRHALAREKFLRWLGHNRGISYICHETPRRVWKTDAWHEWHRLECP
jgi:hypothetical protein